jgi:hypothetical protein
MKSVTGVSISPSSTDIYASALRDDIDPNQALREARKTLDEIGEQFDSGEYDRLSPSAFHAMDVLALAWARIGWARSENLDAMQFLDAAWRLSQSGTVGNRLARVLEKLGQHDKASHAFAMAVAAGGGDVAASKEALMKLSQAPDLADKVVVQAGTELLQRRTVKLPSLGSGTVSAQFALVFDGSNKPERAEWLDGDAGLRSAGDRLRDQEYWVKFPDVSSVKIVRKATLSCDGSTCAVVLTPLEGLHPIQQAGGAHTSAEKR